MIFMKYGAPPHYATAVLHFLNDELPGDGLDAEGLSNGLLGHVISPNVTFFFGSWLKYIHNAPQPLNKLNMQSMMYILYSNPTCD